VRCSLIALVLSLSRAAAAFVDPSQFYDRMSPPHPAVTSASGEGVYFTGAPRFAYLTCKECHTSGPGKVQLKLGADAADLFSTGYVPGQTYGLEVELLGETKGLDYNTPTCTETPGKNPKFSYVQCNNNSFGLEVDTFDGTPISSPGSLCAGPPSGGMCPTPDPLSDETTVAPDGDAVFGNRRHDPTMTYVVKPNDPTRWHLWWTAPPAGTGPVTIYVAAVDGNGGLGNANVDQDPFSDDTVDAAITVPEQGGLTPPRPAAGCAAGAPDVAPTLALATLIGLASLAYRLRRRRP
jgi:hypothetical protein